MCLQWLQITIATTKILKVFLSKTKNHKKLHIGIIKLLVTEIVNNSEIMQNCLVNYFSSIEYPYTHYTRLVTPEKCTYKEAIDYDEYVYTSPRPWDEENPDGLKKGEFRRN